MGSFTDLNNFGEASISGDGDNNKPGFGNFPLASQSSLYSLKLDELQCTFSGLGKDFGSMNMEELLKNLWSAEDQGIHVEGEGDAGSGPNGNLQRQGSLTLPRILGQKTVDEVWTNLLNENASSSTGAAANVDNGGGGASNVQQKEQTMGEMTLEEFLTKAGVVREDMQQNERPGNNGFNGEAQRPINNNGFMGNRITTNNMPISSNPTSLPQKIGELSSFQQHKPLFPKQANVAFTSPMNQIHNLQLANPVSGLASISDPAKLQGGDGLQSVGGLGRGVIKAAPEFPVYQVSPDVTGTKNTSSLSPASYVYNPGTRGRKASGGIEKVVERRHRRMIKNRESAARSRARKQAYNLELEAEIAVLKEKNEELQRKQEEIIESQKKQEMEELEQPREGKRICYRRTLWSLVDGSNEDGGNEISQAFVQIIKQA